MNELNLFGINIPVTIYIPIVYFLWVSIFIILKKIIFEKIRKLVEKTKTQIDDLIFKSLDMPLNLLIFVSGAYILDKFFQFKMDTELLRFADIGFKITAIIAIIMLVDRFFRGIIQIYAERVPALKSSKGVLSIVVRMVVMGLGMLILMDSFGVSITPIVASLGIGSLAVALALQPTLENFFSGIQIVIDRPIAVGQFIKIDSGEKGYVEKIGWRSTWVRMLPNNVIVIPNKVLVDSKILNYHYPQKEISIYMDIGVHYDSDLDKVEKVTIEVANEILKEVTGGVPEFEPHIRYHTFGDSSIDFKVILRAQEFVDGYLVKHEFVKRLHKRYKTEGIIIPYPIQTLDWNPGSDPLKVDNREA